MAWGKMQMGREPQSMPILWTHFSLIHPKRFNTRPYACAMPGKTKSEYCRFATHSPLWIKKIGRIDRTLQPERRIREISHLPLLQTLYRCGDLSSVGGIENNHNAGGRRITRGNFPIRPDENRFRKMPFNRACSGFCSH